LYKKKQQHRQKRRENSAILQGRRMGKSKSKSKGKSFRKKSNNKRSKAHKSYNKLKQMEMPKMPEKEPTSIVDEFCKDLYNFLEESKVENKSRSILKYLKIFK